MSTQEQQPTAQLANSRALVRRFLIRFLGLIAVYYVVTEIPWVDRRILFPVLQLSARGSSWMLHLMGQGTSSRGIVVQGPGFAVAVRRGCDPLEPVALLSAAIVAFPALWKRKVVGLIVGVILLFALNLIRISSLYWLGKSKSRLFELVHLELWPACFIVLSLVLWVLWLLWLRLEVRNGHA